MVLAGEHGLRPGNADALIAQGWSQWYLPENMGCDRGEINLVNCRSSRPAAVFTNVEIVLPGNSNLLNKYIQFFN